MQGFELKRRGELKLIKVFQSEVSTFQSHMHANVPKAHTLAHLVDQLS